MNLLWNFSLREQTPFPARVKTKLGKLRRLLSQIMSNGGWMVLYLFHESSKITLVH